MSVDRVCLGRVTHQCDIEWSGGACHYITLHYITLHYITLHHITLHYITVLRVSGWSSPAYNTLRHLDLSHLTALTFSTSEVEIPSPDLSLPSRSSSLAGLGRGGRQSQKRSLSTSPPAASQSLRRELVTFLIM